jgi:hypothetical protein
MILGIRKAFRDCSFGVGAGWRATNRMDCVWTELGELHS